MKTKTNIDDKEQTLYDIGQCISSLLRNLKGNANLTDSDIAKYITTEMTKDGFEKGISRSMVTKWQSETDTPEITAQSKYIKYIIYLAFQKAPDLLKEEKYKSIINDYFPTIIDELSYNNHNRPKNENMIIYYEINRTIYALLNNIYNYTGFDYLEYQALVDKFYISMLENNNSLFLSIGTTYYEVTLNYSLRKLLMTIYSHLQYSTKDFKLINTYFLRIYNFLKLNITTSNNISFPYEYEIDKTLKELIESVEKKYNIYYSPKYLYAEINIVNSDIKLQRNIYLEQLLTKCTNTIFEELSNDCIITYKQKLNLN